MYYRYFGLTEAPFSIAVNPRYLFMSARHRDALAHLLYGVGEGGGFVLLTGEVGTGKTTIIRSLLEQLPETTDLALVFNPALEADELLASVCDELGIDYSREQRSLKQLTDNLHRFLLENHAKGRHTVLLIDEAQHLKFDVMEQIRLLTNLETNTKKLLQIILVGQPELRDLLNRPELRQLAQRITARYQLKPLNLQETDDYIRHRLQVAGMPAGQRLFPHSVVKAIHRSSHGVPRLINVLCDRMLLGTYGQNKTVVDRAIFKQAQTEVLGEEEELAAGSGDRYRTPLLAAVLVGIVAIAGILLWRHQPPAGTAKPVAALATPRPPVAVTPPQESVQEKAPTVTAAAVQQPAQKPVEETPAPAVTPEPKTPPVSVAWFDSESAAIGGLLAATGAADSGISSCSDKTSAGLRCERLQLQSWQELRTYNRPMVLKLITPAKMLRYAVLLGFDGDNAFVRSDGKTVATPIAPLGQQWTGDALFFWRAGEYYKGPVSVGDSGPMVKWLAQQFAHLDHQISTLTDDRFNTILQRRVVLFQQANQLQADGVVGLKTLLKLNEKLDAPVTLLHSLNDAVVQQDKPDSGEG